MLEVAYKGYIRDPDVIKLWYITRIIECFFIPHLKN